MLRETLHVHGNPGTCVTGAGGGLCRPANRAERGAEMGYEGGEVWVENKHRCAPQVLVSCDSCVLGGLCGDILAGNIRALFVWSLRASDGGPPFR